MNISNALFSFTEQLVGAAEADTTLYGAQIHADVYEEIKPGKTIRIDDLRSAVPEYKGGATIIKANAIVNIFFISMPATQKLTDRLAARQLSEDMADAWLLELFNNPKAVDTEKVARFCRPVGAVSQFNDWIKPGTVKMPVCILRLQINP